MTTPTYTPLPISPLDLESVVTHAYITAWDTWNKAVAKHDRAQTPITRLKAKIEVKKQYINWAYAYAAYEMVARPNAPDTARIRQQFAEYIDAAEKELVILRRELANLSSLEKA